ADFALGDYSAARSAWRHALEIDPADHTAAMRADLSERIVSLDSTQRGLSAKERYLRSKSLVSGVLDELMACRERAEPIPDDVQAARMAAARTQRPPSFGDAAETNLAL